MRVQIFVYRRHYADRPCSFREKLKLVLKATRQHARNLATFALVYKSSMIVLRNLNLSEAGKEGRYDSFFAGLIGGYTVFGRNRGSVSQQVCMRALTEVICSLAEPDRHLRFRPSDAGLR